MGTDEDRVTRVMGGTDKKKMAKVAEYYLNAYGKSLVEDLKDELSGTFLKASCRVAPFGCVSLIHDCWSLLIL